MVIRNSEGYQKKKDAEHRLFTSDDEKIDQIIDELRKESSSIILLAYMYAKNFEETEADLTQRFKTLQEQQAVMQKIYNKGYEDGFAKGRQTEYEKYAKIFDNAISGGTNGTIR